MKKLLLMLVMMLSAMWLFGQKGLFGLSYGDSYAVAKEILEKNEANFTETSHTSESSVFSVEGQKYVDTITLYFKPDTDELVTWLIYYNDVSDENIEEVIVDAIVSWHEDIHYWDDDYYCWVWPLTDNHRVYAGYNWDDQFVAEYHNDDYPDYTEFEW